MHKSITAARVIRAVERDDNSGFCIACGKGAHGCEPDMRKGECGHCGAHKVYGAEELLMYVGG